MEDYPQLTDALSRVLTRLREQASLSKRRLSQLSGIDRVYILQVEQGKYRPTVNFIFLLAEALGIPASTLLSLVESEIRTIRAAEQAEINQNNAHDNLACAQRTCKHAQPDIP